MGRRVCFLGTGIPPWVTPEEVLAEIAPGTEVWAVNEAAHMQFYGETQPPVARVFQLHVRDWRESERRYLGRGHLPKGLAHNCFGRGHAHVEYLRTCGVPVYCQRAWDDIPTCVVYPFQRVKEAVGIILPPYGGRRLWAASSWGYMAALLLTEHLRDGVVEELQLIGAEVATGSQRELKWEWPNLAYYLGLMTGLGFKITLPSWGSGLLSAPHYALDGQPHVQAADHWWVPGYAGVIWDGDDDVWRLGTKTYDDEGAV